MPHVIFVGAGPVGVYTAIQAKLLAPELDIVLFEKYVEYQRKHILSIDASSYVESHPDERFQQLISQLVGTVRTNDLEDKLLTFARAIGVRIEYKNITSTEDLAREFPETPVIVGSDGSHSLVRKQVFNDELETHEDLQYVVEIKYEVSGKARLLNTLSEYLPAMTQTHHLVSENVGKEKEGISPVTARFFVDQATFEELKAKGVTFKNPLKLHDSSAQDSLAIRKLFDSINAWVIARHDLTQENRIVDSEKITAVNLPIYRSKEFAREFSGKRWFLVGDAALGVPYFRSLNAGLLSGTQLAKLIHEFFHPEMNQANQNELSSFAKVFSSLDDGTVVEKYNRKMTSLAEKEISRARWKDIGVNSAITYAETSQALPMSSIKLPAGTTRHIREARAVRDDEELNSMKKIENSRFSCAIS